MEPQFQADGDSVSLPISATDTISNNPTYSATGLPPGLSMDATTGLISGTIGNTADANSPYYVIVTASDGSYNASEESTFVVAQQAPTTATFTVNTLTDAAASNPNIGPEINVAGDISLRSAIKRGNAITASNIVINFSPGLNGSIVLDNLGMLPDFQKNYTVNGEGANVTVARTNNAMVNFRIFNIPSGSFSTIQDLTISGGNVGAATDGGGISNAGTLSLSNVWVTGNQARDGGGSSTREP